jgi:hypothetical protein
LSAQAALALDRGVIECGAAITGTANWSGNHRHRRVGVVLRYWTQGRGDVDAAVVDRCYLGVDEAGQARFRIDVPQQGPVTYNGQLIRLFWQAEVRIPVTRASGRPTSGPAAVYLTVVPRGWTLLPPSPGSPGRRDG